MPKRRILVVQPDGHEGDREVVVHDHDEHPFWGLGFRV